MPDPQVILAAHALCLADVRAGERRLRKCSGIVLLFICLRILFRRIDLSRKSVTKLSGLSREPRRVEPSFIVRQTNWRTSRPTEGGKREVPRRQGQDGPLAHTEETSTRASPKLRNSFPPYAISVCEDHQLVCDSPGTKGYALRRNSGKMLNFSSVAS